MNKIKMNSVNMLLIFLSVFTVKMSLSQTFIPVSVTGFNIDAVAETAPNSLATTTQALDAVVPSNSVLYSASFATTAGFLGGLPNTGIITSGLKTYQLMPYTANNCLNVTVATTKTLTLTTPSKYSKISFLVFSTEGASNINVVFKYTDLSSTNMGNYAVTDWFGGTGAIISGIGRCKRVASGATYDGVSTTNPRFYPIDLSLSCIDQQKNLASIVITGNSGTMGAFIMAVSGVDNTNAIPTINYSSTNFCSAAASITPTLTGISGGTYSATAGGITLNSSTGIINLGTSSPNTYTVTYVSPTTCSLSTTFSLSIIPSPTITMAVASPSFCSGGNTILSGSGGVIYSWSPNTNLSSSTGAFVLANPLTTTTYTLIGTLGACSSTAVSTVTVFTTPTVSINSATICAGDNVILNATSSTGGGNYLWTPTNQTTQSISVSPILTTTYNASYTIDGCVGYSSGIINVNPIPTVAVNSVSICSGQSATLSATPSIGGGNFLWLPDFQTTSSVSYSPSSLSTYSVVYALNSCTASASGVITINPNPVVTITPSSTLITTLDNVIISATGGDTYFWNTGETTSNITSNPQMNAQYCVTVTTTSGCSDEACVDIFVFGESTLHVPNVFTPNGDLINDVFYISSKNITELSFKIFNRWGESLFETSDPLKGWDGKYKGQLVTDGVYEFILSAKGVDGVVYKKSGHVSVFK